jgi:hypothetical protein
METITIFGSCRQTPITRHFPTTSIQEKLNYTHYTKKILQQIRFLKYKNISNENAGYCFRSGILNNFRPYTDDEITFLQEEFDRTTVFIAEIASRISYKWNDLYMHHIAEETQYNFFDRENVIKSDLTDEEIEEDLVNIRNELYPKKLLVVSHFCTYNHGKRYDLIQLLSGLCVKYDIPFFDQSDIIHEYGTRILKTEPVLAHYTEEGEQIVGKILNNLVEEVIQNKTQTIYQTYYVDEIRAKTYGFHGFGDYIRGTIFLYQLLKKTPYDLKVNFSNHSLSQIFVCDNHLSIEECKNSTYIFRNFRNSDLEHRIIFTNNFYLEPIDDACKQFIIKNCLTPRLKFNKQLQETKSRLVLVDNEYFVIHIRLSDDEVFNEKRLEHIISIINRIQETSMKFLLISSNELYMNRIDFPNIIKTNLLRQHMGLDSTIQETEDTMTEFMLMKTCKKIFQLSVYDWGSGFSDTINRIFDIPVDKYKI